MRPHTIAALLLAGGLVPQTGKPGWTVDRPLQTPVLFAEGVVSTQHDEMDAGFARDGLTIYFTKDHIGQRLGVIVSSQFRGDRWSEPGVVPFSGRYTDYDPFVTLDGSKIFFASNRPVTGSNRKDFDIWYVEKT